MAILTFEAEEVRKILEHSRTAPNHRAAFGQKNPEPGLLLVGDEGVYLMSNGIPRLMADGTVGDPKQEGRSFCVHAEGMNPETDDPEMVWDRKCATFGGSDGSDYIPAEDVAQGLSDSSDKFQIQISENQFGIIIAS